MSDNENKFWAFICCSQQDNCDQRPASPTASSVRWGDCLAVALKAFSIPAEFIGQINGRGETIPDKIRTIFPDQQELSENAGLSAEIRQALEQSICLVVICSPRSATSLHVNEVVRYFKQLGRGKNIFPVVVAGEPNISAGHQSSGSPASECFVPALRHPLQPDGALDTKRRASKSIFVDARHGAEKREIWANDHRSAQADLEMAKIQLIALLVGVGFNGLWWREQRRHFFDLAEARQQTREALHQVAEARRQLEEAQQQALENQKLPPEIHGQIQAAQTQARDTAKLLQEFQNQVRETQTQLEAARQRAHVAESKVLETQQQARELQNQLEMTRSQARETQNKVLELQSLPPAVSSQSQEAQSQLAAASAQAQDAQNKLLTAQNQVQEFQRQARSAESQLAEARNEIHAAESNILVAQQQACEAQEQVQTIQNQTRDAQSQIKAAQDQVQKIQIKSQATRRLTRVFAILAVLALLAAGVAAIMTLRQRQVASEALAKAEAEAVGKFELAAGALGPESIRQLLGKIGGAEQSTNRQHSLEQLASSIPCEDIPEALKTSAVMVNDQQRSRFQKSLLVRLGEANPMSAMTNASAIAGDIVSDDGAQDSVSYFQLAVLAGWLQTDFPAAFNWACSLPDTHSRQLALDKIIQWLKSQPDSASKNQLLANGIDALATTDVFSALALAEWLPEGAWRNTLIARLWLKADPYSVLKWFNSPDFLSEIGLLPRPALLWSKFFLNPNADGSTKVSVETEMLSTATNSPVQIKPPE